MKKTTLPIILFLVIVFIGMQSLLAQKTNTRGEKAKWTIMIYMDGDNDLEPNAIKDMNELEMIGSTDEVNFIVQFDRIDGYDNSNDDWTETRRYKITKDEDTKIINSPVVQNIDEANMGKPETVTDFINWSVSEYPAEKYMFIFWNHGGGWQKKRGTKPTNIIRKDVCFDETNDDDYLDQIEVANSINATGVHFDILGFDACLMGMLENMYSVRNFADILIASTETEPMDGWDYYNGFLPLIKNSDMTTKELSSTIVETYNDFYKENTKQTVLSAIDLSKIETIIDKLNALTVKIMDENNSWDLLEEIRNKVLHYEEEQHIDLHHWLSLLSSELHNEQILILANELKTEIDEAVFANNGDIENSNGIAIYYPRSIDFYLDKYQTEAYTFSGASNWDEFLNSTNKFVGYNFSINITDYEGNIPENCSVMIKKIINEELEELKSITTDKGLASTKLSKGELQFNILKNNIIFYQSDTISFNTDLELTIQLPQAQKLSYTINDFENNPVNKAGIVIYNEAGSPITYNSTSQDGNILLNIPSGIYYTEVFINEVLRYTSEIFEFNETTHLNIQLPTSYELNITIKDTNGKPIEDVEINIYKNEDAYITSGNTNNEGIAIFNLSENNYYVSAYLNGTSIYENQLIELNQNKNIDIQPPNTYKLSIAVKDKNGKPIEGIEINITNVDASQTASQNTNNEGIAVFSLSENNYYVSAYLNGTSIYENQLIELNQNKNIDIQPPNTYKLSIAVKDKNGKPVENIEINIYDDEDNFINSNYTNNEGITIFNLSENNYYVSASLNGISIYNSKLIDLNKDKNTDIQLPDVYKLNVTVKDANEKPVEDIEIIIYNDEDKYITSNFTNNEGIAILNLSENNYYVSAYINGVSIYENEIFEMKQNKQIDIVLPPNYKLNCNVIDAKNNPVDKAEVRIFNDKQEWYIRTNNTDAEGNVIFDLFSGNYYAQVIIQDIIFYTGDIFEFSDNTNINIQLPASKELRYTVTSKDGNPVPNAYVYIYNEDQQITMRETDFNGNVLFNVPNGNYYATVNINSIQMYVSELFKLTENISINIQLPITHQLGFAVSDINNNPIYEAFIAIYNTDDTWIVSDFTDIDGKLYLDLCEGSYYASVYVNGETINNNEVFELTEDLFFNIQPEQQTHSVTFTVTDTDKCAVENANVSFSNQTKITDQNGKVVFENILAGDHQEYEVLYNEKIYSGTTDITDSDKNINVLVNIETSISENTDNKFNAYPNPSNGIIYFDQEINNLSVFDINGKLVAESQTNQTKNYIDLQNLKNGIYFIKTNSRIKKYSMKIVINR